MKDQDFKKAVLAAGPCFVGEFRGCSVEKVEWVDKKDGKASSFVKASHLFEFGAGGIVQGITIEQSFPAVIKEPGDVQIPFQRGKRYLLRLQKLDKERRTLNGRMDSMFEPMEVGEA